MSQKKLMARGNEENWVDSKALLMVCLLSSHEPCERKQLFTGSSLRSHDGLHILTTIPRVIRSALCGSPHEAEL